MPRSSRIARSSAGSPGVDDDTRPIRDNKGSPGYFLTQKVLPQWGHPNSISPLMNTVPGRVRPLSRYSLTGTGAPQESHGLIVRLRHHARKKSDMRQGYAGRRRTGPLAATDRRMKLPCTATFAGGRSFRRSVGLID